MTESRVTDDAEAIVAWLDERPTMSRFVGAARRFDQLEADRPDLFEARNVAVIRNFTIEPIEPLLKVAAYRAGLSLRISYSGYDPGVDEGGGPVGEDTDVVIIAVRLEELSSALTREFLATGRQAAAEMAAVSVDHVVSLARVVRDSSRAAIVVHNFVSPAWPAAGLGDGQDPAGQINLVRRMNLDLAERIRGVDGAYLLDVDHLFARVGLGECVDSRGERVSGAPLGQPALRTLAVAYVRHIRAIRGPAAKCVVVDCDNTLWGGVVGEDGIARLVLGETGAGRAHRDLQQNLLDLRRRGIVLAICSKNEEADVLEVLRSHPDCLLREDDFVAMRINWDDKADNLMGIAEELNLALDHIVFVDDNPVECAWVKTRLPAVRVVQWPGDLGEGGVLDDLALFDSLVVTDEDLMRTEMYRAESSRREARQQVASHEEYLESLEMVATVELARPEHLARLAQLTQRTNQFNLTTRRYDIAGLEQVLGDADARLVWLELRDRFGAHGIVGCGILRVGGETANIDTLLLSCRVLGRNAEVVLVNRMAVLAAETGATTLVGEYILSQRNAQVADLYGRLGFDGPEARDSGSLWRWNLASGAPQLPAWFAPVKKVGVADV